MKTVITLSLLLLFFNVELRAQETNPATLMVGFVDDDGKYHLSANFGIEQWENGKLTTHRYQIWDLLCSPQTYGAKFPFDIWCSLERIVIDNDLAGKGTKYIGGQKHYVEAETFKVTYVDWPAGKFDFEIVLTDTSTVQVALRFKRWRDTLFLDSFKAIGVAPGIFSYSLAAIEYRIPEYSYILNIPTEMKGRKSAR
jgi:hypothetical protein